MRCGKCHESNPEGSNYCTACGSKFDSLAVQSRDRRHRITGDHILRFVPTNLVTPHGTNPGSRHRRPISRTLQYGLQRAEQNAAPTLSIARGEASPVLSLPPINLSPAQYEMTRQPVSLTVAVKEVRYIACLWELVANAGRVRMLGDPGVNTFALIGVGRRIHEERTLDALVRRLWTSRAGWRLLAANWLLVPVGWRSIEDAKNQIMKSSQRHISFF